MNMKRIGLTGLLLPAAVFAGSLDILSNRQGLAQYDLSVRGSSYAGTGISINGLNLRAPYSAHFNSELPLPAYLLSDPAAQTGIDNVSGHLIGTAAYTTVPQEQAGHAKTVIGTKEYYAAGISSFSSGIGGFMEGEKARRIDYSANDLERHAAGALAQHFAGDWQLDLIGAHQRKEFGAQGYYGISKDQVAEQMTEDSLIVFSALKGDVEDSFLRAGAGWRQFDDQYTGPSSYDVRSRYVTAAVEGRTIEIQHIALNLRGDIEHEQADGTYSADRTRGSILILPEARFEKFILKAGLNTVMQTSESAEWLPLIGADWLVSDNSTLYASYSESVQQPDYQTLEDNPLLQMQQVKKSELGLHQFLSASLDWRVAAFHRQEGHASDWIGGTVTDLGTLHVYGAESGLTYVRSDRLSLQAFYLWAHKDNGRTDGLYELDYPEHLLRLSAIWQATPEFGIEFSQTAQRQTANDARTGDDFGASASLGLHYLPRSAGNVRLSFRVDNLWGSDFQPIPGLKPRPITVTSGITVTW